jgi:Flp pilus assembly protein CpaB
MKRHPIYHFFVYLALIITVLVAGWLISQLIAARNMKVMVLVAKHYYPKGTAITDPEEFFEFKEFRMSDVPIDAVYFVEQLQNCTLMGDVQEGQAIQFSLLEKNQDVDKKEANLRHGMKRFSLLIESDRIQGGFVLSGCFVDIFYEVERENKKFSKMVAENVPVIAVDGTCDLHGQGPPPTVILNVTERQAQILKSQKNGAFAVTVRKVNFNAKDEPIKSRKN